MLHKRFPLPIDIVNIILELANTGLICMYNDKIKRHYTKIHSSSLKFDDIQDLLQNRIKIYHKTQDYNFFNCLIQYDISELCIVPRNKNKIIYYKTILYCTLSREIERISKNHHTP